MSKWIIVDHRIDDNSAWSKAPLDIERVLLKESFLPINMHFVPSRNIILYCISTLAFVLRMLRSGILMKRGDVVVLQNPVATWGRISQKLLVTLVRLKKLKLIVIVHELIGERPGWVSEGPKAQQDELFALAHKIVVHTENMKRRLQAKDILGSKMSVLGIFDYLTEEGASTTEVLSKPMLNVAGNLSPLATGYLKEIKTVKSVSWNLYGSNYEPSIIGGENVRYSGVAGPDELPSKLTEGFGLVWYGDSLNSCEWPLKDYLTIIMPHKLSLYLASGMPVVVHKDFACADFVAEHHVGLVVSSVYEAIDKIKSMNEDDFAKYAENAASVGYRLRDGYYIKRAIGIEEGTVQ